MIRRLLFITTREFFEVSLVAYLILLIAEKFKQGIVTDFFKLNAMLGIVMVLGLIMAITWKKETGQRALENEIPALKSTIRNNSESTQRNLASIESPAPVKIKKRNLMDLRKPAKSLISKRKRPL